jgi:hypothetical protein
MKRTGSIFLDSLAFACGTLVLGALAVSALEFVAYRWHGWTGHFLSRFGGW